MFAAVFYLFVIVGVGLAQMSVAESPAVQTPIAASPAPARNHDNDIVLKAMTNQKWYAQLGGMADIQEIRYTSAPVAKPANPTAPGAKNPLIIHAVVFVPKNIDKSKKHPFLVFAHQGIHSDFGRAFEISEVRELLEQGYSVIGPDYRGSTGYGANFYNQIDYGGLEVEDVFRAREWMLENFDFLDAKRAGIIGWSHGGLIALMNILQHPDAFAAAYAGVPVTDLVLRLGYRGPQYASIFSAQQHIGKPVQADIDEYLKRSPITHAAKLATPLLIHGNTNDEDVNVIEVERFVTALKAAGKKFEYKIYENAPGGHEFGRLDTKLARESRREIYRFLAGYLKPARGVQ
ncbi:MAG: S9 family peptidase [Alkalinema sp. CACIAM 70d]|nr:MAG: S9 family peptidase [Alkalinema sp. CACIAM 70d]